jgi:hypothetical protein
MQPRRVIFFLAITLFCCSSALAQQPGPQFWRKLTCEPLEPRTHLERLENLYETVMIKAFTRITTVEVRGVRIDAVAIHDLRPNPSISKGIVISLREEDQRREDNRAFIDYDEIGLLLNAIDVVSRIDETATRLPGFEARYKTKGDFEITVFRQTQRGTAVLLTTGICDRATQTMTLDDFGKIKAMLQEAKSRLDEIR